MAEDKKKIQTGQQQKTLHNSQSGQRANESAGKAAQPKTHVTSRQPGTEGTTRKNNN